MKSEKEEKSMNWNFEKKKQKKEECLPSPYSSGSAKREKKRNYWMTTEITAGTRKKWKWMDICGAGIVEYKQGGAAAAVSGITTDIIR